MKKATQGTLLIPDIRICSPDSFSTALSKGQAPDQEPAGMCGRK